MANGIQGCLMFCNCVILACFCSFRHINVPEMEFLQLAQMSHLKRLVVLDPPSLSSISVLRDLIHKLNIQTHYRVYVIYSSQPKDQNACLCTYHL